MHNPKMSVAVGAMVVIGLGLFLTILAILGRFQWGTKGFYIDIEFGFLNNLTTGAPVRIAGGISIGYVEKIFQKDLKTYVRVLIDGQYRDKIPKKDTTVFAIYTTGIMGQKYVNISFEPAKPGEDVYRDGDVAKGIDPPSIDQMLMAFSSWFDGKNGGQVLAEIMKETQKFVANLNGIATENRADIRMTIKQARESFISLSQQLDTLMQKLNILSKNFSEISTKNKQDIQVMLENMSRISRDLNLITQRINSGRGSIGKFIQDEDLYTNANEAVANARDLFRLLREKPWLIMYKEN